MSADAKSINPSLLTEPELMAWLGYKRRLELQTALRELGIPYALGKGGTIISTVQAVNTALLGERGAKMKSAPIEF